MYNPPALTSQVLGLKMHVIIPSSLGKLFYSALKSCMAETTKVPFCPQEFCR